MSSWLVRKTPLGGSLKARLRGASPLKARDLDAVACFESFRTHWKQAWDLIQAHQHADLSSASVSVDEINCVLNHVDQLVTLLLVELRQLPSPPAATPPAADVSRQQPPRQLELFLSERVLERLLTWSRCRKLATSYSNVLRTEQLRLHDRLLRQAARGRLQLLSHGAVLRPLTELLQDCSSCRSSLLEFRAAGGSSNGVAGELNKQLVQVLGLLCGALHSDRRLLELFLSAPEGGVVDSSDSCSFVVFALLVEFVHCDGVLGRTARDALLLCMQLSQDNRRLAHYVVHRSNFCVLLASGLSGLYSALPRKLLVIAGDRYQLLSPESKLVPELHTFVSSLEFCNAVLLTCHPMVRDNLLEFVHHGFLVSVLGPALHQNTVEETITSTAYMELFLRCISEPGLVRSFLLLLLTHRQDGCRTIDTLVRRISNADKLCVVTLSLFDTMLELNCEDVLLELVLRHLLPCTHVMVSQRPRLRQSDQHAASAERFLSLVPACCQPTAVTADSAQLQAPPDSPLSWHVEYALEARALVSACRARCAGWTYPYDGLRPSPVEAHRMLEETNQLAASLNNSNSGASVNGANPEALVSGGTGVSLKTPDPVGSLLSVSSTGGDLAIKLSTVTIPPAGVVDEEGSIGESSGYQSFNLRPSPSPSPPPAAAPLQTGQDALFWSLLEQCATPPSDQLSAISLDDSCRQLDAALSRLYPTSLEQRTTTVPPIPVVLCCYSQLPERAPPSQLTLERAALSREDQSPPRSPTDLFGSTPSIGGFLHALLTLLSRAPNHGIQLNLQLMSVISRLCLYPQPLLRSFLLDDSLVFQPSVPSLLQTLADLKRRLDVATGSLVDLPKKMHSARHWLAAREEGCHLVPTAPTFVPSARSLDNTDIALSADGSLDRGEYRRLSLSSMATRLVRSLGVSGSTDRGHGATSGAQHPADDAVGFRSGGRRSSTCGSISSMAVGGARESADDVERRLLATAVLLQHCLMEVAAIAREHSVCAPSLAFSLTPDSRASPLLPVRARPTL